MTCDKCGKPIDVESEARLVVHYFDSDGWGAAIDLHTGCASSALELAQQRTDEARDAVQDVPAEPEPEEGDPA